MEGWILGGNEKKREGEMGGFSWWCGGWGMSVTKGGKGMWVGDSVCGRM